MTINRDLRDYYLRVRGGVLREHNGDVPAEAAPPHRQRQGGGSAASGDALSGLLPTTSLDCAIPKPDTLRA